jgi:hypothetical protein
MNLSIWNETHVLGRGVALEIWLNGLVLLVEVGQIRDKVLDDVGVRQRVDARFGLGIGGNAAWAELVCDRILSWT